MTFRQWRAASRTYKLRVIKRNILGTSMVMLPFLGFLCFTLFPMLLSLFISFSDLRSALISEASFTAGFSNYISILRDEYTWKAMRTTLVYSCTVLINLALSLFLSSLLHKRVCGKKA